MSRRTQDIILICFTYLLGLGLWSVPITGDQKFYISVALEMRERGSWLIPYFQGEPCFIKPPLQFWLTLLSWKITGVNLFGALLPSFIAMLLVALMLPRLVLAWFPKVSREQAQSVMLVFAALLGTATFSNVAQMEIHSVFFWIFGWWTILQTLALPVESHSCRFIGFLIAFAAAGVSGWLKSPLYSVLWVLSFFTYLLLNIRSPSVVFTLKSPRFYLALLLGVSTGLIWFLLAYRAEPALFWNQYLMQENLNKRGGNGSTPWGIWISLLYWFFPYTLLLPAFFTKLEFWKQGLRTWIPALILPAVFFTMHPYRVNTYLFLLCPVLSVALVGSVTDRQRRWLRPLGYFGLSLVVVLRLASSALVHRDLGGLVQYLGKHPEFKKTIVLMEPDRTVWTEWGWFSVLLQRDSLAQGARSVISVNRYPDAIEHLKQGDLVIVKVENEAPLQSELKLQGIEIDTVMWKRLPLRRDLQFRDFFSKKPLILKREFKLISLHRRT